MSNDHKYKTVESRAEVEHRVKDSKFIGNISPVNSKDLAENFVDKISSEFSDASHNVFAYLIRGVGLHRYDDAGEPSGSAGKPVFKALKSKEVENVVIVVSRYFGGTELGYGGLVRAYNRTAVKAIEESGITTRYERSQLNLEFGYEDTSNVEKVLRDYDCEIKEKNYTDVVEYYLLVRKGEKPNLIDHLRNITSDRVSFVD